MNPLILSPDRFRKLAADVVALTAGYLSTLDARPVFPPTSAAETEQLFAENAPGLGLGNAALEGLVDVIAHSRAQNGRFLATCRAQPIPSQRWAILCIDPEPEHNSLALIARRSNDRAHGSWLVGEGDCLR